MTALPDALRAKYHAGPDDDLIEVMSNFIDFTDVEIALLRDARDSACVELAALALGGPIGLPEVPVCGSTGSSASLPPSSSAQPSREQSSNPSHPAQDLYR